MGSLREEMVVKPTMSLKYRVIWLKCSGLTGLPVFSACATDLRVKGWRGERWGRGGTHNWSLISKIVFFLSLLCQIDKSADILANPKRGWELTHCINTVYRVNVSTSWVFFRTCTLGQCDILNIIIGSIRNIIQNTVSWAKFNRTSVTGVCPLDNSNVEPTCLTPKQALCLSPAPPSRGYHQWEKWKCFFVLFLRKKEGGEK